MSNRFLFSQQSPNNKNEILLFNKQSELEDPTSPDNSSFEGLGRFSGIINLSVAFPIPSNLLLPQHRVTSHR